MKKAYEKPEVKKVNFEYTKVVATSGYCDQGWTQQTTQNPNAECPKCYEKLIWIGSTNPFGP
jgi:hypothetical protein